VILQNKIITRGLGGLRSVPESSGLVVQGYGPLPPAAIIAAIERPLRLRLGQSGTKRRLAELDEVIVWAKMIEANGVEPKKPIKGWIRVRVRKETGYASVMAEVLDTKIRSALDYIKVTVSRLR
jgi:hypothetical protein